MADAPAEAPAATETAPADTEPAASAPVEAVAPTEEPPAAPVEPEAASEPEAAAAGTEASVAPDEAASPPKPAAEAALGALGASGGGGGSSELLKKFKKAGKKAQLGTRFATMSKSRINVQLAAELAACTPERLAEVPAADDEVVRQISEKLNDQIPKVITDPRARGWFKLFQQMDADGSGKIAFDEFAGMVRREVRVTLEDVPSEVLLGVWKVLDADGSGLIQVRRPRRRRPRRRTHRRTYHCARRRPCLHPCRPFAPSTHRRRASSASS